jgi:hypothetical protein
MISREELFLGLAVAVFFASTICYIAIGDAFNELKRRFIQRIFTLRKGFTPRRRKGLRIVK